MYCGTDKIRQDECFITYIVKDPSMSTTTGTRLSEAMPLLTGKCAIMQRPVNGTKKAQVSNDKGIITLPSNVQ